MSAPVNYLLSIKIDGKRLSKHNLLSQPGIYKITFIKVHQQFERKVSGAMPGRHSFYFQLVFDGLADGHRFLPVERQQVKSANDKVNWMIRFLDRLRNDIFYAGM